MFYNKIMLIFKKMHRPKVRHISSIYSNKLFLPENYLLGLKAHEGGNVTTKQLESIRRTIKRYINKEFFKLNVIPYSVITSKPLSIRMGKGKGSPSFKVYPVKKGDVILEVDSLDALIAEEALLKAREKLPIKTKIVYLSY